MAGSAVSGKRLLCAVFMAAALGGSADALALSGRDTPALQPGKHLPEIRPGACVQRVPARNAARNGYHSLNTMRRSAALSQIYDPQAVAAMAVASYETGIDFNLLVMKALLESRIGRFDEPHLGGSARGLFHFMPATWMTLFSWFGAEFQGGIYAGAATAIKFDDNKNPYTDHPALTEQILSLRSDHYMAAFIKAKSVLHDERPLMRAVLGREPSFTDYYVAHFLGLERAKTFFRALRKNPHAIAADIFVRESEDPNNRPIFYQGTKKRTVQQVYNLLGGKVNAAFRRLDNQVAVIFRGNSCVPFLQLQHPQRMAIEIPPAETAPPRTEGARPETPPEDEEQMPPAPLPQEDILGGLVDHFDQGFNGGDRMIEHFLFFRVQSDFNDFFNAAFANHYRNADVKPLDAVFPVQLRCAG